MSDEHDFDLPEDVRALLEEGSGLDEPDAASAARVWERLEATLGAPALDEAPDDAAPDPDAADAADAASEALADGVAELAVEAAAAGAKVLSVSKIGAALWTAATLTVGAGLGAGGHAVWVAPDPTVAPVEPVRPAIARDVGVVEEPDAGGPEDAGAPTEDAGVDAGVLIEDAGASEVVEAPRKKPRRATSLRDERVLLGRAQRALAAGEHREALELVREHRRTFGARSSLGEERDALYIRALLGAGERERAERAWSTFQRRYPHSILTDVLSHAFEAP